MIVFGSNRYYCEGFLCLPRGTFAKDNSSELLMTCVPSSCVGSYGAQVLGWVM